MKHLLIGAAVVAALGLCAPVWAQPAPSTSSPGASTPAPAPPAPTSAMPSQMNRMPAGGRATSNRGTGPVTRAHHRRHAVHAARSPSAGGAADQLNRQELGQLQTSNPTTTNRMSVGGKATSGTSNQ